MRRFFTDCGYELVNLLGLRCASPVLIAHVTPARLRQYGIRDKVAGWGSLLSDH